MRPNGKVSTQLLGPRQQRNRRVHSGDLGSSLRQGDRMPSVATPDINDLGTRRKMKEIPKARHFEPNVI
jgi:hypothetical protein